MAMDFRKFQVKAEVIADMAVDFQSSLNCAISKMEENTAKLDDLNAQLKLAENAGESTWQIEGNIISYEGYYLREEVKKEIYENLIKALEKELKS